MSVATVVALAIVAQNQIALRASPRESAPQQAVLWQGDTVEVRGQTMGYLKVYDHRRERAGYIRVTQARRISTESADAPELLTVVRFLRSTPGAEALGVAYAAAYLKAVPASALTAEPFDALGEMADRLAHRASTNQSKGDSAALVAHLEVVAQYGLVMNSFDVNGAMQVCYDGEMFRQVLSMPAASDVQRARAALGLTRHECVDPHLGPTQRLDMNLGRAGVLDRVSLKDLAEEERSHMHLRRAGIWAALAFEQSRRGDPPQAAAERALEELAAVNQAELSEEGRLEYTDAAIRVGASRWAAQPQSPPTGRLVVKTMPGEPGETCVLLLDTRHGDPSPLIKRCTYATVWNASASANPAGTALTLAVQPLETWRELWVFRQLAKGWSVAVIPPGTNPTEPGYLEFAGWVPGAARILTARELKSEGQYRRRFEIMNLNSLAVEHQATTPEYLSAFWRWQEPRWKHLTLAVR